jgi:hypothetical protein
MRSVGSLSSILSYRLTLPLGLALAIQSRKAVSDIIQVIARPSVPIQEAVVCVRQALNLLRAVPMGAQFPIVCELVGISLELYKSVNLTRFLWHSILTALEPAGRFRTTNLKRQIWKADGRLLKIWLRLRSLGLPLKTAPSKVTGTRRVRVPQLSSNLQPNIEI